MLGVSAYDFLEAFKRHIYRYGLPLTVQSDNASQFRVGAVCIKKALEEDVETREANERDSRALKEFFAKSGIRFSDDPLRVPITFDWSFTAAYNPQQNSKVESVIKSIKKPLVRTIKDKIFTYSEFQNILTEINFVINSRPLAILQAKRAGNEIVLSPSIFLHFRNFNRVLNPLDKFDASLSLANRLKENAELLLEFFKIFQATYLHSLRKATNHYFNLPPLIEGEIVMIKTPNVKRLNWEKARVLKVQYDTRKVARVASLLKANGNEVKRGVQYLVRHMPESLDNIKPLKMIPVNHHGKEFNENEGIEGINLNVIEEQQPVATRTRAKTRVNNTVSVAQIFAQGDEKTIWPSAKIQLLTPDARVVTYVVLDSGSAVNVLDEKMAKQLNLKIKKVKTQVVSANNTRMQVMGEVELLFTPHFTRNKFFKESFLVVRNVAKFLPHQVHKITFPQKIRANPDLGLPRRFTGILGMNFMAKVMRGVILNNGDGVVHIPSELGLIQMGSFLPKHRQEGKLNDNEYWHPRFIESAPMMTLARIIYLLTSSIGSCHFHITSSEKKGFTETMDSLVLLSTGKKLFNVLSKDIKMIKFIDALEIFSKNALNHYEKMPEQTPYKQNFFFGSITMCKTYDGAVTINFKLKGLINPDVDQDLLGSMLMTANEQEKILREVDEICVYTVKNNYMANKTTLYQKGDYSYILIKNFFYWSMKSPQSPLRARSLTEALRNSLMLGGDRRRPTEKIPGSSSRHPSLDWIEFAEMRRAETNPQSLANLEGTGAEFARPPCYDDLEDSEESDQGSDNEDIPNSNEQQRRTPPVTAEQSTEELRQSREISSVARPQETSVNDPRGATEVPNEEQTVPRNEREQIRKHLSITASMVNFGIQLILCFLVLQMLAPVNAIDLLNSPMMTNTHTLPLKPGVAIIHEATIYLRAGTHRAWIDTQLNAANDQAKIDKLVSNMDKLCDKVGDQICSRSLKMMKQASKDMARLFAKIIRAAGEKEVLPVRRKRDYNPNGILPTLMRWIIGWSPSDEKTDQRLRGAASALQHQAHTMSELQNRHNELHSQMDKNFKRIEVALEERDDTYYRAVGDAKLATVVLNTYETFKELIEQLKHAYSEVELSDDEIRSIVARINHEERVAKVPPLSVEQLIDLSSMRYHYEKNLSIEFDIPLVYREDYHLVNTIPIPHEGLRHIPKMTPHKFVVSEKEEVYALWEEVEDKQQVNNSITIIKNPIFSRYQDTTPCDIATVMKQQTMCPWREIKPGPVDIWIPTAIPNAFAYMSTVRKNEICSQQVNEITATHGIMYIKQGCKIVTAHHEIRSTIDFSVHIPKIYHIEIGEQPPKVGIKSAKARPLQLEYTTSASNDTDKLIREAEIMQIEEDIWYNTISWKYVAIGVLSTIAAAAGGGVAACCVCRGRKRKDVEETKAVDDGGNGIKKEGISGLLDLESKIMKFERVENATCDIHDSQEVF
ncbi:hypothetical protein PVAND_014997 [Polypedilum vanderplanki]|uniref:Integrase catalytic domain-containing protein n=1 Tax=Polypedilum vanderplanki TaxID=319348 RepID=A0A9J6BBC1_POLVA|nr:hypothetical protein PVAND_014997 [Polypedilum vanderplanki]